MKDARMEVDEDDESERKALGLAARATRGIHLLQGILGDLFFIFGHRPLDGKGKLAEGDIKS